MDVPVMIGSINGAIDVVRHIATAGKSLSEADLKLKIAELTERLADAKLQAVQVTEEIAGRDKEIARLRMAFARRDETVVHGPYHYRKGTGGKPVGEPFCPRCLEVDGRLSVMSQGKEGISSVVCTICGTSLRHVATFIEDHEKGED